jgi:hypothetical protein
VNLRRLRNYFIHIEDQGIKKLLANPEAIIFLTSYVDAFIWHFVTCWRIQPPKRKQSLVCLVANPMTHERVLI